MYTHARVSVVSICKEWDVNLNYMSTLIVYMYICMYTLIVYIYICAGFHGEESHMYIDYIMHTHARDGVVSTRM